MIDTLYKAYRESSGVCIDTRSISQNNLFIALKGPSFNANDFVIQALNDGCRYAIADEDRDEFNSRSDVFIVDNALETLQQLANYHRRKLKIPIISLTGSNGKTTTKELMKAALNEQYECYATKGNLNNHIGVPLSLLEINSDHEIAIIEMGANHKREIATLCEIAEPGYGLITNIGLAHLDGFGGEEGVFIGKKELFDYLIENDGTLFVNKDDEKTVRASSGNESTTYGSSTDADFSGTPELRNGMLAVTWSRSDINEKQTIQTRLSGIYNFSNVMAAVTVARYFGVPLEKIKKGIESYIPSNQRSQLLDTKNENTVIVDCYNANPSSMDAALRNLAEMKSKPSLAILGDMKELGDQGHESHLKIVNQLSELNIADSILIGEEFSNLNISNHTFRSTESAKDFLIKNPIHGRNILLKGSRSMKLEQLLELL
ncbi:MAG: UDP-N-acetylmuramoyl-tripeptide--D-alanyl-D-alanine ligase [Flavobacteriales bacterium]